MVTLYKRVEKSKSNLHGFVTLDKSDNPLKTPTMICLSAQALHPKSVFGIVREGMRAARLRTSQGKAGNYALNGFPVNFVGLTYDYKDEEFGTALARNYFLPLISDNGQRIDIKQAKKNLRNITFMTYCDGVFVYAEFEEELRNLMKSLNYDDKEIKDIINELAVVEVLTMADTSQCLATRFQIVDVNDQEIFEEATPNLIDSLNRQNTEHDFLQLSDNHGIYYFSGHGKHSIKALFENNYLPHAMICAIVSQCLTRSIDEKHEFSFENIQDIINSIINHYSVGYTPDEIMKDLDDQIDYVGARKLSNYECEYLDIIDELSRKANNLENDNRLLQKMNTRQAEKYQKLDEAVKTSVTQIDYLRILKKIGYQFSSADLKLLEEAEQKKK